LYFEMRAEMKPGTEEVLDNIYWAVFPPEMSKYADQRDALSYCNYDL
ncbi:hypothetical protein NPIL_558481, partial [Nephila pilipes]